MSSRTVSPFTGVPPTIQSQLEVAGLRRTLATRAVLGLFLAQPRGGLSHAQVLAALGMRGLALNRVTLYRLLDRLAACGVLQRYTDEQTRTWRFRLAPLNAAGSAEGVAPRFECDACHRRMSLTAATESTRALHRELLRAVERLGHHAERVEVSVRGTCANCVESAA
ncbi:Fur family transcriptional regulator [Hydrogenophaga sp.]|uniref:Fur family transcriptional regulator n=1 Tax=Hydrogenophaga sp. TaxID=1904254 RepID=UPI003D0AAB4A